MYEDIIAFEDDHNIKFTNLYTKFLLENNGGDTGGNNIFKISDNQGESVLDVFLGIDFRHYDLGKDINIYKGRMPNEFIPIACDPGGNIICLGIKNEYYEKFFFWDHENENDDADMSNMYFLASNIYEFVSNLRKCPKS